MNKIIPIVLIYCSALLYMTNRELNLSKKRIKELEFENRQYKFNRHTDSVVNAAVVTFRKRLDSLGIRMSP